MQKINFDFTIPQDPYVEIYDPEDKLVLKTNNDILFLSICCQIKEAHAEGYYVIVPSEMERIRKRCPEAEAIRHPISPYGRVKIGNSQMFHVHGELLRKLI